MESACRVTVRQVGCGLIWRLIVGMFMGHICGGEQLRCQLAWQQGRLAVRTIGGQDLTGFLGRRYHDMNGFNSTALPRLERRNEAFPSFGCRDGFRLEVIKDTGPISSQVSK